MMLGFRLIVLLLVLGLLALLGIIMLVLTMPGRNYGTENTKMGS